MRPSPDARFTRCCANTPRRWTARVARICSRTSSGAMSSTRDNVFGADDVCNVPKHNTPVSAACNASCIVSCSRTSPTTSTSGASRNALFTASAKLSMCAPTCRCVITLRMGSCKNSIGSSIVMTCFCAVLLISCTIAASVVVLPEPVGPRDQDEAALHVVESDEPRAGSRARRAAAGRSGMMRNTAP